MHLIISGLSFFSTISHTAGKLPQDILRAGAGQRKIVKLEYKNTAPTLRGLISVKECI